MFIRLIICGVGLLLSAVASQADGQQDFRRFFTSGSHTSLSGQFIVHDPPVSDFFPYYPQSYTNYVRMDPTLLMVSCEHIKQALMTELGARDQWQGRIIIDLHHSENPNETILVSPGVSGDQWVYRIAMPDFIDRYRVVSVVVQTVMLEIANRGHTNSTEIPAWLAEGMTRQVIRSSSTELVLEPPTSLENGVTLHREDRSTTRASLFKDGAWAVPRQMNSGNSDPIAQTLEILSTLPPLSLEELSWPKDGQFVGDAAEAYRCSAQLFVHQLLHLQNGRACMQAFLPELSRHLNWQIAFLQAFHSDFASQLDLDKWWALRLVQLTGRDLFQAWTPVESWNRLDEVLNPAVEIRSENSKLPLRGRASLQVILLNWDLARQRTVLPETDRKLSDLRTHVDSGLIYIVDDYRRVLGGYLRQKSKGASFPMGKSFYEPEHDEIIRDTVRQFDALDRTRKQLAPKLAQPQPIAAATPLNH